MRPSL
jgi:hypothetical protein